ncbi:hypothetical protein WG908_10695 [Sphingobium sp. AN641]|uniref:hypothetical protein n=1 Tax=Sphingobium sp. AN641 TaxID=3133443 RepID=UPI0030BCD0C9
MTKAFCVLQALWVAAPPGELVEMDLAAETAFIAHEDISTARQVEAVLQADIERGGRRAIEPVAGHVGKPAGVVGPGIEPKRAGDKRIQRSLPSWLVVSFFSRRTHFPVFRYMQRSDIASIFETSYGKYSL